jgi:hypothetical protein
LGAFIYESGLHEDAGAEQIDIDKSWQLIHFLLTGDAWQGETPLRDVVLGGVPISDEDVGYGPARYLTAVEVKQVNAALSGISGAELWLRFDAGRVEAAEIYPSSWGNDDRDVIANFESLRRFYASAALDEQVVLQFLN